MASRDEPDAIATDMDRDILPTCHPVKHAPVPKVIPSTFGRIHPLSKSLALILMLIALLAGAARASAEEPSVNLSIAPVGVESSYFSLTMSPGESRDLTVEFANFGTSTVTARAYVADAYSLVNGGFGARLDGEPTSGTTLWVDYAGERLDLEPGSAVTRTFRVTVPAGVKPGEYLTSMALQNGEPVAVGNQDGAVSFNQVIRQVIAISIDIPGPRAPGLEIGAVTHKEVAGKSVVVFGVTNPGNVRLTPSGEFVLTTLDGTEVSRTPVSMNSVYAQTETSLEVPLAERLNPGDYFASLTLSDRDYAVTASSDHQPFTVNALPTALGATESTSNGVAVNQPAGELESVESGEPDHLILVGAGALAMLLVSGVLLAIKRRRQRNNTPPEAPLVQKHPAVTAVHPHAQHIRKFVRPDDQGKSPSPIRRLTIPANDRDNRRTGT